MAKAASNTVISVQVQLTPKAFEFLSENAKNGDISGLVTQWCTYYLDRQARGGLLLEPEDHDYLAGLNDGKRFRDSRSLVRGVEKGMNREEGQHTFKINVDPAHFPALKENADMQSLTVEEALDGIVQMIFASGWIYNFDPRSGRSIPFTPEMLESCKALCEKNKIDSSDIAGLIAEDRLLPITREMKDLVAELADKRQFDSLDVAALLAELKSLRAENDKLKTQVMVAA